MKSDKKLGDKVRNNQAPIALVGPFLDSRKTHKNIPNLQNVLTSIETKFA